VFLGGSGSSGSGGGKESSASKCPDDMAYIAGATFQMGSDEDDSSDNEVHQVKLSAFCMDKYEFTNADLKRLKKAVTDLGTGILWPPDPVSDFGGDDQPLVNVNWNEADAICKELGKALPTEAQWEHAAKTDRDCEYGTKSCNIDPTQADACFSPNGSDPKEATCEVGSTNKPNSFGLHDMSGNVWEWVADWYEDSYGAEAVADPTGPDSGTYKVLRGGSWFLYYHPFLRAAFRLSSAPDYRGNIIGFRCAASPQN
jgi:formylglycine-generating enzyme required for sulfatase activity